MILDPLIITLFFVSWFIGIITAEIIYRLYHRGILEEGFIIRRLGDRHVLWKNNKCFDIIPADGKYKICPSCKGVMKFWELKDDRTGKVYDRGYQCFDCPRNMKERII